MEDEMGGGSRGFINSENTTHIDLIDLGPKSKVHEVDLQKGIAQGSSARGATEPANHRSARQYKNSRERSNNVSYIPSSRNSLDSSRSPHHNTVVNTRSNMNIKALDVAPQHHHSLGSETR